MHMIALCLIRIAMLQASRLINVSVAQLSFARALTETRLFVKLLLAAADVLLWTSTWQAFVLYCARHRAKSLSQTANSPEIGSNIEERAAVWCGIPMDVGLKQRKKRHHGQPNPKPKKIEKVGCFC
jgi:hypothetical protein